MSPLAEESEEGIVCPVLSFIFGLILSLNLDIACKTASFRNPPVSPHSPQSRGERHSWPHLFFVHRCWVRPSVLK